MGRGTPAGKRKRSQTASLGRQGLERRSARKRPRRGPANSSSEDRDAIQRDSEAESERDPLGKVIVAHRVTLARVLFIFVLGAAVGGGVLAYASTREIYAKVFLGIGGAILYFAVVASLKNLVLLGRRLELRKYGLRYVAHGSKTDFRWDDIVDLEIIRKDKSYYGRVRVDRVTSDEHSPSGLLTTSTFDVTIHARDGDSIRLTPTFMKAVPNPKKLIQRIRMGADVPR